MNNRPFHEGTASARAGPIDCDEEEARLASQSLAAGDPTGWFEKLYAAGERGHTTMPFDRAGPHPLLVDWAENCRLAGHGRDAIVVGCGLGADAEYIAGRGLSTVAFDISETAIRVAQRRHPASTVDYRVADLLNPRRQWQDAFDLVVEIITVQALPDPARHQAITNISRLVGEGGTLLVIAAAPHDNHASSELPPWPLDENEIEAFASDHLNPLGIEIIPRPNSPSLMYWRAEFRRVRSTRRIGEGLRAPLR